LREREKKRDEEIADLKQTIKMLTTRLDSIRRVATGSTFIDISEMSQCHSRREERNAPELNVANNSKVADNQEYSDDTITSEEDVKESNIDKMHRAGWKRKYGDDVPYVPLPRSTEIQRWKIVVGDKCRIEKVTDQDFFDRSDTDEQNSDIDEQQKLA